MLLKLFSLECYKYTHTHLFNKQVLLWVDFGSSLSENSPNQRPTTLTVETLEQVG